MARTLSRTLPPRSCQTGAWKCLPRMSHSAWSIAEMAPVMPMPRIELAR